MQKILCLWCVLSLFLMSTDYCVGQGLKISGVVLDEDQTPLPGVTVKVKNASLGTVTDVDGKFSLNVTFGEILIISFMGRRTEEVVARDGLRVVLYSEAKELSEAIVQVAYGSLRKQAVTGAVSSVTSDEIARRPVTAVTSALEGAMPGVLVFNTYGQPGDANEILVRIRGFASVNGVNTPLYVVDGIPFEGNLAEINPVDIESISVLKDAAAASLYGNRAANGVVLITRKKATTKTLSMEFTVRQGIYAQGMKDYERIGTKDFMEVMWKSYRNSLMTSNPTKYSTTEVANAEANASLIQNILKYNIYQLPDNELFDSEGHLAQGATIHEAIREDLDWFNPLVRKGFRQEYSLNGGAVHDKSDYHFSLGYLSEDGYLKDADFDRLTARLQLNLKPKQWLGTGLSLSGSHHNQNITDGKNSSFMNVFNIARYVAPIYPLHLHDLETGEYVLDETGEKRYDDGVDLGRPQYTKRNIVWENSVNRNKLIKTGLTTQAYADIKLPQGFTFTVKGDLYLANQERNVYYSNEIGDGAGVGRALRHGYRYKRYAFQQQLNWQKQFGKHLAEVFLAHENYYYNYEYTRLVKYDQVLPDNLALNNFTTLKNIDGYPQDYRTESYLGRIRYNYDGKYFAETSFRRDGSSRFHPDHRWGNFGSVGLGWIASNENFIKEIDWIDYLKLRFAYGEVGNDESLDYYAWMSLYTIVKNGGTAGLYKSQNVAEDIRWETVASYDGALEVTLFKRWNFTLEYFDKRSKDLLFDVSLPLSAGSTSTDASEMAKITRNLGRVSNKGWEISSDIDIIRTSQWRWNVGANATFMKNKILTLPAENRETGIVIAGQNQKYMEGHSIYEWWLPLYAGVDRFTGNSLYLPDLEKYYVGEQEQGKQSLPEKWVVKIGENYYTTNTTYARKDWCGSAMPKFFGSFSTKLEWKGISLSALFTYSVGGKIYDKSYSNLMSTGTTPSALHRDILKAWDKVPQGITEESPDRLDPDGIPVVNSDLSVQNNAASSRFLIDGSYLWVKNISLSYTLPSSLVRKINLQGISLNFLLENVAMFSKRQGMNPQQSFTGLSEDILMAPKVISVGLTVKL